MIRENNGFAVKTRVPYGSTIYYGFLITKKRSGGAEIVWDGSDNYEKTVIRDSSAEVNPPGKLK